MNYDEIDPQKVFEGLEAALRNIPIYLSKLHKYMSHAPTTGDI